MDRAVFQEDFNHVETEFDARIFEEAQIIERSAGQALAFLPVHGSRGTRP